MMKKQFFLCFSALALCACASSDLPNLLPQNAITKSAAAEKFVSFFNGTYRVDSSVKNLYTGETYTSRDESSSSGKVNVSFDSKGNPVTETHIVSSAGIAMEQYLDLSNNILTREIGSGNVSFKDNYASPFNAIMANQGAVSSYFDMEEADGIITFTANENGLARAASSFASFFTFYGDIYRWDSKSVKETVEDLVIVSDAEGNPATMSFSKVKADRYGGIRETYTCTLSSIEAVTSLAPVSFQGSAEKKEALTTSLNLLASKIAGGNFTQTIFNPHVATAKYPYHNFYQFDAAGNGVMLSDIPFYASGYGTTYIGIAYSTAEEGYYMVGVSPEAEYYGAAGTETIENLLDCMPNISRFSPEFCAYNEEEDAYVFDLDAFLYDDYLFSFSVLDFLFGQMDPCADKFGYFLSDDVWYAFNFHALKITIDAESGLPTLSLCFEDSYQQDITVTTTFGDFGTTDIRTNRELSAAYDLLNE